VLPDYDGETRRDTIPLLKANNMDYDPNKPTKETGEEDLGIVPNFIYIHGNK
jgi:hypothetical protein